MIVFHCTTPCRPLHHTRTLISQPPPPLRAQGTNAADFTLAVGGRFGILPTDPVYSQLQSFAAFAKQIQVGLMGAGRRGGNEEAWQALLFCALPAQTPTGCG